jgi:alpha-tubulin suppressor-like RCC1 family protein
MFGGLANKINLKNHEIPYLYFAGDNTKGLSGFGTIAFYKNLTLVSENNWSSISTSRFESEPHTLGIKNGQLWAWGRNDYGQLGDGTTITRNSPVQIGTATDWEKVSTGGKFTLAIRGGELYAWGRNNQGQLGTNNTADISSPVKIGTNIDWFEISAGNEFSMGIRNVNVSPPAKGNLFTWGLNSSGQLGLQNTTSHSSPVRVGTSTNWFKVAAGNNHSLALNYSGYFSDVVTNDPIPIGGLFGWGMNDYYQCGHTLGGYNWTVDPNSGNYWWWWWWWYGQQGPRQYVGSSSPIQVGSENDWREIAASANCSIGIRRDPDKVGGNLFYWGNSLNNGPAQPTFFTSGAKKISQGNNNFAYIRDDSYGGAEGLYVVGDNAYGQLGNAMTQSSFITTAYKTDGSANYVDVSAGYNLILSIKNDDLYGTGRNNKNLVFIDPEYFENKNTLTKIEKSNTKFIYIDLDAQSAYGIINGELYSWGNAGNQLGLGSISSATQTSPVRIGNDVGWTTVKSGGGGQVIAIKNGELYAWGENAFGRGFRSGGSTDNPVRIGTENTWTKVGAGETVSFAIREGKLFGCGWNIYSQLPGIGSGVSISSPVQIGTDTDWTHISGSWQHALGIRGGKLYAWGTNSSGQLGLGNTTSRSSPVQVGTESDWTIAWAGTSHSVGIRGGKLFTWGGNSKGQLGNGTITNRSSPVQIGANTDWTWVYTNGGGNSTVDSRMNIGIRNGELYAWGQNTTADGYAGLLGDGTSTNRSSPVRIGTLSNWIMACCSYDGVLAIR